MSKLTEQLKNPYLYVVLGLLVGITVGFIGLDFEQSTITSKANWAWPLIVLGAVLFFGGLAALIMRWFGSGKKKQ